jgi:nicotinate-nucleotide pyrophosphorylase (carboxylating)
MDEIEFYLKEDLNEEGDITSNAIFKDQNSKAQIISKESCVVAGLDEAKKVFNKTGATIHFLVEDGQCIKPSTIVAEITGSTKSILTGERLALNFICRMSGIASLTKQLVDKCKKINPNVNVAATRKTTPGFRFFEKKAVKLGGGETHRFGLYDAFLIKDNHIKAAGSVEAAINKVKQKKSGKIIEVEAENEKQALTAAEMNVDFIMLDNLDPKESEMLTKKIKKIDKNVKIEISGGITPDNILDYAAFADRISMGFLTHSVTNKDFSLKII